VPKSGQAWNRHFLADEPLFRVFEPFARDLRSPEWPTLADYARHLEDFRLRCSRQSMPLGVAASPERSRRQKRAKLELEELYDGRIALTGQVYCLSESYHDLFNIIVFAAFPQAKRALHARQFRALRSWLEPQNAELPTRLPGRRTREQDALTLFDEGGVVLAVSEEERARIGNRREPVQVEPFNPRSGRVPLLFGHALLEHLHDGHRALRASGLIVTLPNHIFRTDDPGAFCTEVDSLLAARLENPVEFLEPRADCIFELGPTGGLSFRAPDAKSRLPKNPSPHPQGRDENPIA
jgi:hypothetical protein